jgi:hypothetical protein
MSITSEKGSWRSGTIACAALAAAIGCKGSSSGGGPRASVSAADNDRLLALAPAGARVAVVVSGRAIDFAEATVARARELGRTDQTIGSGVAEFDGMLSEAGLPAGAQLGDLGLTRDRGLAWFKLDDERAITIWPVADRARFVAAFRGRPGAAGADTLMFDGDEATCREVKGVYACADDAADLDRLGTGSLAGKPAAAGARGDVEIVALPSEAEGSFKGLVATVAIERGQVVVRTSIKDAPAGPLAELASKHVTFDPGRASGFVAWILPLSALGIDDGGPVGAVMSTMQGQVTAVVPSGVADVDVRVPFTKPDAIRGLLAQCDRLPLPPTIRAARDGDSCIVTATEGMPLTATVWLDGNTLRISRQRAAVTTATGPAPTAMGRELARGSWNLVFWGRGTTLGSVGGASWGAGADGVAAMRLLGYLTEFGLGVRVERDQTRMILVARSVLANPDPVADAMPGLISRAATGADVSSEIKALAAAHPNSDLADDLSAGQTGLMLPTAAIGVLAAVAIPKFLDYMKAGKRSEAEIKLNAIGKAAQAEYAAYARFPVAAVELTPARPCCEGPGRKCAVVAGDWNGVAAWDLLGFEMTAPFFFRYSYRSDDGLSFVATAEGDLDCDGNTVTYTMRGQIVDGTPELSLTRPTRAD